MRPMKPRIAAILVALLTGAGLAVVAPAAAAPAGMVTVEVPPLPWQDQQTTPKRYTQVTQAQLDAARNAPPATSGKQLPPRPATADATCSPAVTCYTYGRITGYAGTDLASGVDITITTSNPFVPACTTLCEHSLGATSAQNGGDIVEVGWIVDHGRRADGNPTLFGFHYIAGASQGYDVAFVDFSANPINLGAGLPKPFNKRFYIGSTSTAFWVGYDTDWVAWVPRSRFGSGPFGVGGDAVAAGQGFYEVASLDDHPCIDMGTKIDSNPIVSATGSIYSFAWINSATAIDVTGGMQLPSGVTNNPDAFNFVKTGATAGRGSGPGYNAAGTAPGTPDAC